MAKVYLKKGNLNYKERKYISAIEKALTEKGLDSSEFNPATNFGELETLYNKYCVQDVEFTEITSDKTDSSSSKEDEHKSFRDGVKDTVEKSNNSSPVEDDGFTDPFNQGEVKGQEGPQYLVLFTGINSRLTKIEDSSKDSEDGATFDE